MSRRTSKVRSSYKLLLRIVLSFHLTLFHSRAHHQEIDFYSFYRFNSSLRRRAIFISSRKVRGWELSLDASLRQIISR